VQGLIGMAGRGMVAKGRPQLNFCHTFSVFIMCSTPVHFRM
jgi:hypothetical protein